MLPSEKLAEARHADMDYQKIEGHRPAGSSTKFSTLVRGLQTVLECIPSRKNEDIQSNDY
jgi:hypothetical protein